MSSVIERAGTGRTSFYECFDDFEHAFRAAAERSRRDLERSLSVALNGMPTKAAAETALSEPPAPRGRLVQVCCEWVRFASDEPEAMVCALSLASTARLFVDAVVRGLNSDELRGPLHEWSPRDEGDASEREVRELKNDEVQSAAKLLALSACAVEVANAVVVARLAELGVAARESGTKAKRVRGSRQRNVSGRRVVEERRPPLGRSGMSAAQASDVLASAVLRILR